MEQDSKPAKTTSGTKAWSAQSDPERMEAKRLEKMQAHSHSHRVAGHHSRAEQLNRNSRFAPAGRFARIAVSAFDTRLR